MTLQPVPDVLKAFLDRLRQSTDLMTLVGSRISGARKDAWPMPTQAIVAFRLGGPPPDWEVRHQFQRIQIDCYGANDRMANDVWRYANAVLFPEPPAPVSFTLAHCIVFSIQQEMSPAYIPLEQERWPRVVCSYLVRYSERYVP